MGIDPKSAITMFTFAKETINELQNSALEKNETMFAMQYELHELRKN